jgi:hypothetical protein
MSRQAARGDIDVQGLWVYGSRENAAAENTMPKPRAEAPSALPDRYQRRPRTSQSHVEPDMNDQGQPRPDWTVVLRRRPTRIVEGRPEGGYTDEFEIICCDCGDDPGLDYREVSRGSSVGEPGAGMVSAQAQHAQTIRRDPIPAERL